METDFRYSGVSAPRNFIQFFKIRAFDHSESKVILSKRGLAPFCPNRMALVTFEGIESTLLIIFDASDISSFFLV